LIARAARRGVAMAIIIVPQLSDNFAYLVIDDASKECAVVDCAEADKVIAAAKHNGVKLTAVLTTHWHGDHSGGNQDIAAKLPGLKIYGASAENGRIPALTNPVADGDTLKVGGLEARVIGIPAHTNGHVAYYFPKLNAVFTGDTMFVAGCGRVFEGRAATMVESLKKLSALPDSTQVYCGHEYTEKNLRFALTLEPNNAALKAKHEWAVKARSEGKWTVPSTIADEKRTNPFLRSDSPELRASVKKADPGIGDDPIAIFAKARELKDHY
jgi:hydroxyacylglutathione hydrolase